jgi:DNA invertase Pin-like site-specific DNA recombinase
MNNSGLTAGKITALYSRLSKEDSNNSDDCVSNSIVNQRAMLEAYATRTGFENVRHFTDDGHSGATFNRPSWNELIAAIDADNVAAVIVKDMSRVGRNYLQSGYYTEVLFRQKGVRFISISDNIDSTDENSTEFAPIINLMAEWHSRDCSRKIKSSIHAKGNSGKPTTTTPIYGYMKDPADRHKWVVDKEAAAIVRQIFRMTIEGLGNCEIANILTAQKVMKPSSRAVANGNMKSNKKAEVFDPHLWRGNTVKRLLSMPEYLGHTVNFRTEKIERGSTKFRYNSAEDWKIFENTHEAIIDKSVYDAVQEILAGKRELKENRAAHPLHGLVFCADCRTKMSKRVVKRAAKEYDYFGCESKRQNRADCSCRYITVSALEKLVLSAIKSVCGFVHKNEADFSQQVRATPFLQDCEKSERVSRIAAEISQNSRQNKEQNAANFIAIVKQNIAPDELKSLKITREILQLFVEKIYVHDADKSGGKRNRRVDIHFKLIGRFAAPSKIEAGRAV